MATNVSDIRPSTSSDHATDTLSLTSSDRQCTDDAEFVEQVMRTNIERVVETVERIETSDTLKAVKDGDLLNTVNLSGNADEKISQLEKRKRESDSGNSDDNVNVRKKSKGVRLKSKGRRNALKVVSDKAKDLLTDKLDSNISDIETETGSDLVIMLKALTILENKMDKRFDEIKEINSDSIRQMKGEIDAVRLEFNNRVEGLSKKVVTKVTDSVQ